MVYFGGHSHASAAVGVRSVLGVPDLRLSGEVRSAAGDLEAAVGHMSACSQQYYAQCTTALQASASTRGEQAATQPQPVPDTMIQCATTMQASASPPRRPSCRPATASTSASGGVRPSVKGSRVADEGGGGGARTGRAIEIPDPVLDAELAQHKRMLPKEVRDLATLPPAHAHIDTCTHL